jgi:hypothetical protein
MEIKTKFNPKDIVYFLTVIADNLDDSSRTLKKGEAFVCKAEVGDIEITTGYEGKYNIVYSLYIRIENGTRQVHIHEDFCAPDPTQLGLDVTNRYYKSGEKKNR